MLFWQQKKYEFPRLYDYARHILCIQIVNCNAERQFSGSKSVNTVQRLRLNPDVAGHSEFIKSIFSGNIFSISNIDRLVMDEI